MFSQYMYIYKIIISVYTCFLILINEKKNNDEKKNSSP